MARTNVSRTVTERSEYEPYGKVLAPATPTDGPGYTSHLLDTATGLNYPQQRYYDSELQHFISVDPVNVNTKTGDNFNRYWYANNNPYTFTDPDGRQSRSRVATQAPRTSAFDVRSTAEARDLAVGRYYQNEIRRLDPNRSLPQFIRSPSAPAFNRITNETLRTELMKVRYEASRKIAYNGHSFRKHVREEGQFSGIASTPAQYASHINYVLNNFTHTAIGPRQQGFYYHAPTSTIVIVNPYSSRFEGGTAFQASFQRYQKIIKGD